jgi:hypothetical protein
MSIAAKVRPAIEVLPVVLDAQRVLAEQVGGPLFDDGGRGLEIAPRARLAQAGEAGVGLDLDKEIAVDENGLYVGDFHRCPF